ncbi:right-handed parallel beta-helix repeat-containing protein [Novosphingobium fuchskuhlense]|nr:right-handed parallel beta-helix repeat-containing protein [Novosphingobium fuchskuhlense]
MSGRNLLGTIAFGLFAVIAVTGCSSPPVHAETIYVSPAGTDDNDGSVSQSGSGKGGPVRTIARAQAIVRGIRAGQAGASIGIELAAGEYVLDRPLLLTPADSGSPEAPLRLYGAAGQKVVISGGQPISGWQSGSHGELVAKIDLSPYGGVCPNQLFVNSVRRSRPRFPEAGTLSMADVDPVDAQNAPSSLQFTAGKGDLPPGFQVSSETEIVIIDAWTAGRMRLVGFSPDSSKFRVEGEYRGRKSRPKFEAGLAYYIENQPVERLAPGQWQCTAALSQIRYHPMARESAKSLKAIVPKLTTLLYLRGASGDPVHDVTIQNIDFAHAAWIMPPTGWSAMQSEIGLPAAIQADNCQGIAFRKIGIVHAGAQGIEIGKGCSNVELANSRLIDLGGGGVLIGAALRKPMPGTDWEGGAISKSPTSNIRILHNTIEALGRIHLAGTGVWVGLADHATVGGNSISDLYYSGISVGWVWSDELSPVHDNLIEGNRIENYGQGMLSDMGGIYTLGRQFGTVVRGNAIANGSARAYGGWGLYADRGSTGIAFINNRIGTTTAEAMYVHEAGYLRILENTKLGNSRIRMTCPADLPRARGGAPGFTYACTFAGDRPTQAGIK